MGTKQTQYVLGFAFDPAFKYVVLIEKLNPKWQRGLHNGVGGHVEDGENYQQAMEREFREETGITIPASAWQAYATLNSRDWTVRVFYALSDDVVHCHTTTAEKVAVLPVEKWHLVPHLFNLDYLIPLAQDGDQIGIPTFQYGAK